MANSAGELAARVHEAGPEGRSEAGRSRPQAEGSISTGGPRGEPLPDATPLRKARRRSVRRVFPAHQHSASPGLPGPRRCQDCEGAPHVDALPVGPPSGSIRVSELTPTLTDQGCGRRTGHGGARLPRARRPHTVETAEAREARHHHVLHKQIGPPLASRTRSGTAQGLPWPIDRYIAWHPGQHPDGGSARQRITGSKWWGRHEGSHSAEGLRLGRVSPAFCVARPLVESGLTTRCHPANRSSDRSYRLSGRYRLSATDDNLGHFAQLDRDRGAGGHSAQRRLHAIQTLSQLSYSPTVSCSIRAPECANRESSTVETAKPMVGCLATALGDTITVPKRRSISVRVITCDDSPDRRRT